MTPLFNNDLKFLFILSQKIEWLIFDESTGVPSLSKMNIENITDYIPSDVEQKNIGNLFYSFDKQINKQEKLLEKIIQLKSAYLQKMFV